MALDGPVHPRDTGQVMDRGRARTVKTQVAQRVAEILAGHDPAAAARYGGIALRGAEAAGPVTAGIAVGLTPAAEGGFRIAVRYRLGTPTARMVCRELAQELGPDIDIRRTGRVHTLARAPRPAARSLGESGRVRPLRPGISVAHETVSAGTLGAFVERDEVIFLLSNHHVLVGDAGQLGDPVLQPGPYDGGSLPQDQVGTLTDLVPLAPGQPARVDAALAALDTEIGFETPYPAGLLTGVVDAEGGEAVEKVGRTTGLTAGTVTAIELDGVLVDFGPGLGTLSFDGQLEVESSGAEPFSAGGDSGSLVYLPDTRKGLGLLFAGSDQGGANGLGLTYLNPVSAVLEALGAQLHGTTGPGDPGEGDAPNEGEGPGAPGDSGEPEAPVPGGAAGPGVVRPRAAARRASASVREQLAGVAGVAGVGLARRGDGYQVVVNVRDTSVVGRLPARVRAEARVRVTGTAHALGARGAPGA